MKHFHPIIFIISFGIFVPAKLYSANAQTAEGSFRGLPFGATLTDAANKKWELTPANDVSGEKTRFQTFIRTDEQKAIGDINLLEITYYFLDGKFYGVLLQTADGSQTEILRQALISSRGEPLTTLIPAGGTIWIGSSSTAILQRNQATGEGTLLIVGNTIQQRYEAYVKDAAGKASKDL